MHVDLQHMRMLFVLQSWGVYKTTVYVDRELSNPIQFSLTHTWSNRCVDTVFSIVCASVLVESWCIIQNFTSMTGIGIFFLLPKLWTDKNNLRDLIEANTCQVQRVLFKLAYSFIISFQGIHAVVRSTQGRKNITQLRTDRIRSAR